MRCTALGAEAATTANFARSFRSVFATTPVTTTLFFGPRFASCAQREASNVGKDPLDDPTLGAVKPSAPVTFAYEVAGGTGRPAAGLVTDDSAHHGALTGRRQRRRNESDQYAAGSDGLQSDTSHTGRSANANASASAKAKAKASASASAAGDSRYDNGSDADEDEGNGEDRDGVAEAAARLGGGGGGGSDVTCEAAGAQERVDIDTLHRQAPPQPRLSPQATPP